MWRSEKSGIIRTYISLILFALAVALCIWLVFVPLTYSPEAGMFIIGVVDFSYVSVLVLLGMNLVVGFHRRKSLGCLVIVSLERVS